MARNFVAASSQKLTIGSVASPALPISFACWGRSNGAGITGTLMSYQTTGGAPWVRLYVAGDAVTVQQYDGATSGAVSVAGTITSGTWFHAGGVFTNDNSRQAFRDGTASATDTTAISNIHTYNTTDIGVVGSIVYWNGDIAEAAAWNIALSAADFAQLATGVSPLLVHPEALINYWPLMGQYSPEIDVMVAQKSLTLTNTPVAAVHTRMFYPSTSDAWLLSGKKLGGMFLVF